MSSITRHMKGKNSGSSHEASHAMSHFFMMGVMKPTKLLSFLKKMQINEFIRVKTVIILNLCNKKIIFAVVYIKDVNKSVP